MQQAIRWGIAGGEVAARAFVSSLLAHERAQVIAVLEETESLSEQWRKIPRHYTRQDEFVRNPDLDILYIAKDYPTPANLCLRAAERGIACLCQSAEDFSQRDLLEIYNTAQKAQKVWTEGVWPFFLPAMDAIRFHLATGEIGQIQHVRSVVYASSGGIDGLLEAAKLGVQVAVMTYGQGPERVSVLHGIRAQTDDFQAEISMGFSNGALAQCSVLPLKSGNGIGCVEWNGTTGQLRAQGFPYVGESTLVLRGHGEQVFVNQYPGTDENSYLTPMADGVMVALDLRKQECPQMPWMQTQSVYRVLREIKNQMR